MSEVHSSTMTVGDSLSARPSGFSFDHVHRNAMLLNAAAQHDNFLKQQQKLRKLQNDEYYSIDRTASVPKMVLPTMKIRKTGTTIVGLMFDQGIILGADTRSTSGDEISEKNCLKLHYCAPNIYSAGAGTAADTEKVTALLSSQLELLRMETRSQSRVVTAITHLKRRLFQYQGHIGVALIVGGCDLNGPHLYQLFAHGSTHRVPFATMGSGCVAAMSEMEIGWREGMSEVEAVDLVKRSVSAGIFNDAASGSNVDYVVIRVDGTVDMHRNALTPNDVGPVKALIQRSNRLNLTLGVTPILDSKYVPHPAVTLADVTVTDMEAEETS